MRSVRARRDSFDTSAALHDYVCSADLSSSIAVEKIPRVAPHHPSLLPSPSRMYTSTGPVGAAARQHRQRRTEHCGSSGSDGLELLLPALDLLALRLRLRESQKAPRRPNVAAPAPRLGLCSTLLGFLGGGRQENLRRTVLKPSAQP